MNVVNRQVAVGFNHHTYCKGFPNYAVCESIPFIQYVVCYLYSIGHT